MVKENIAGSIRIYYTEQEPELDEGPFLKEERRLINTISDRISSFILHHRLRAVFREQETDKETEERNRKGNWKVVIDLLRETDPDLYKLTARKMMNYLCWSGVKDAEQLLYTSGLNNKGEKEEETSEFDNRPKQKKELHEIREEIFNIAAENLSNEEILFRTQKWIQEDRSSFLVRILENLGTTLPEIADAIRRYENLFSKDSESTPAIRKGLNVALIRRFLSDQLQFISIAKEFVELGDFYDLLQKMIFPPKSYGKLGGKSVGLFIANKILKKSNMYSELLKDIKIPKTWYLTSDTVIEFLHYNNLEEVFEQKYKDLDQVRQEYPYIVQVFKNSSFPPEIVKNLSVALDDFGNSPLIVRA